MLDSIKVPNDRIAVVIGTNGSTKKRIELLTGTKISVNSKSFEVEVEGKETDALNFYNALNIIKAIGRGFSPDNAFLLIDSDYFLDLIKLEDIVGKSDKAIEQKKSRIIGKNGTARKSIEEKTDCAISVYGGTVGIIGKSENVELARKAVEMLLEGASHDTVYHVLRKKKQQLEEFEI